MVNAAALPWPPGTRPACAVTAIDSGEVMPRHEVRVRPRLAGWPRGELLVEGSPVAVMPAEGSAATFARVFVHATTGDVTELVVRQPEAHPFHADLALQLHHGFEPRVRGDQSRRVIAMLEAAEESARLGGIPVKPS